MPFNSSVSSSKNNRVFVFYHYLHPDDVVSAIHIDELCCGLAARGWQVTAFPANRGCRDESITYGPRDIHQGVHIHRVWRPRFRQSSTPGRLLNAVWMILSWSLLAFRPGAPEAIIVGTDPILSVTIAIAWKLLRPKTRVLHWCFDLYPEAAYADGVLSPSGPAARLLSGLLRHAYRACDAIIDIGYCMRERLAHYRSPAKVVTIVPWALEEPASVLPMASADRVNTFGNAELCLLYSGNFGRAHTFESFLALARELRDENALLAFSVRGNREEELRASVRAIKSGSTCQITFVPFAPPEGLLDRLASADVHLLSLASDWTGTVVPSKFFGALAAGRPILYSGSPDSSVARWITEYKLGWVLDETNRAEIARDLLAYVRDKERVETMRAHCHSTYQTLFSRRQSIERMHQLLLALVQPDNSE